MQADPRLGHINPSRPHGRLPHASLTFYGCTVAIKAEVVYSAVLVQEKPVAFDPQSAAQSSL